MSESSSIDALKRLLADRPDLVARLEGVTDPGAAADLLVAIAADNGVAVDRDSLQRAIGQATAGDAQGDL